MIVAKNACAEEAEFTALLEEAWQFLTKKSEQNPGYFYQMNPIKFEKELYFCLKHLAVNTSFANTLELTGKLAFPDIAIKNYWGIEVKTSQKSWKSPGNSIFETSRVKGIERIYLFFAKLTQQSEFKYKPYEDCLAAISITHSPRYSIDMELAPSSTIFHKMGIEYDDFRSLDNPAEPFKHYVRQNLKAGEEPWWLGEELPPVVRLLNTLPQEEQSQLIAEAFALFPELVGNSPSKYQGVAMWLVARYGVVSYNLRDFFTAGGVGSLTLGQLKFSSVPRIFLNLHASISFVGASLAKASTEDLARYWGVKITQQPLEQWVEQLIRHSKPAHKNLASVLGKLMLASHY